MRGKLNKPEIKQITSEQTWAVRQQAMWPEKPLDFVRVPNDPAGIHFGYFVDQELVSVISLFKDKNQAQFRKFATLPPFQRRGIGKSLLYHVFSYAISNNITTLWCNARTSASGFYLKAGMKEEGEIFGKNGIDYVKMEKRFSNPESVPYF